MTDRSLPPGVSRSASCVTCLVLFLAALLIAVVLLVGIAPDRAGGSPSQQTVRLTVYLPTGDRTYSGVWPYWGSAACSWNYPLGTVFLLPDGHTVVCEDRGMLGSEGWLDLFAPDFQTGRRLQEYYGNYTTVEILRWGRGEP